MPFILSVCSMRTWILGGIYEFDEKQVFCAWNRLKKYVGRKLPPAPYRDGTTHVIFEPLDFILKLVALVPKTRVNLTRFDDEHRCSSLFGQLLAAQIHSRWICHGVFAPNSKHRALVTPGKQGKAGRSGRATIPRINYPKNTERQWTGRNA